MGQYLATVEDLVTALERRRALGDRIVSTNGVFDLLHVGHARYLAAARAMGDVLVVGVNSDASTRALKGPRRPLVPGSERAELVAALACVDYVVLFDELTPVRLLGLLRPHIHVKGGDYAVDAMPETETVRIHGGEVCSVPIVAGRSSSSLLARIEQLDPGLTG